MFRKKINQISSSLWVWLFLLCMKNVYWKERAFVANRTIMRTWNDQLEFTYIVRDMRKVNGYTREELLEMLTIVRMEEERLRWKCPEPDESLFQTIRDREERLRRSAE